MIISGSRSGALQRFARPTLSFLLAGGATLSAVYWSPFPFLFAALAVLFVYPWYRSAARGDLDLFEPIVLHSVFFGMIVVALFDRVYLSGESARYEIVSLSHAEAFTLLCLLYGGLFACTLVGYYWFGPKLSSLRGAANSDDDRTGYEDRINRDGPTDRRDPTDREDRTVRNDRSGRGGRADSDDRGGRAGRAETTPRFDRFRRVCSLVDEAPGSAFRLVAAGYGLLGIASLAAIVLFVFPTPNPLYVFRGTTPRSDLFAGNNALIIGTRGLYLGYLFWLGGALADRRAPSPLELLAVVPVVGLVLVTGGRSRAFQIVLMVSVVAYYVFVEEALPVTRGVVARIAGRAPPLLVLGVLPLVAGASAIALVALRGIRQGQSVVQALRSVDPIAVATAGIQNDWFDNFLALREVVPERFGYFYGSFYLRVPLNFVPGRLWQGKPPLTVGSELRRELLPERAGGRSTGALGDYYVNFGYFGVVLLGLCYGATLYGLSRLLAGERTTPLRLLAYAIFLSIVVQTGLTNEVLYTAAVHLLLLVPGVLGLLVLADRGEDAPADSEAGEDEDGLLA